MKQINKIKINSYYFTKKFENGIIKYARCFTPFCSKYRQQEKIIFWEETNMYDYTVEMMKKYEPEETKCQEEINFKCISECLCIVSKGRRIEVNDKLKETFRKKYKKYVRNMLRSLKNKNAIIMFQGTYRRIIPRNSPRRGMVYIEDNLKSVIEALPKLKEGERYVFPALKVIKEENETDFFIFQR